ncbi:putative damage-inducible protein DinB [Dongia mobilis]|uniref:Putative damage-inducible protein DinB n=1 Tax=Dongia mobilis TaxID=578943 RepID=A0A4R6WTF1_9PROT|nr:DinB family protein [Dongia mobilis]TDQ82170.1 putative damage-inducible protein DinB [Dongia mobilis]
MLDYFLTLARYNQWANARLYAAVGQLDAAAIAAPRVGFFPSLLKTLNHLMVTDRIWLGRLTATPDAAIKSLDDMPYPDFSDLRAARAALDGRIIEVVGGLAPARLGEVLVYKTMAGQPHETPMALVLGHLFNHQTHHRGQAHAMLSGTAVPPPVLDIIYFLRDTGAA